MTDAYTPPKQPLMWWRFRFVRLVRRLFPRRYCWAELCAWAADSISWADMAEYGNCRDGVDVRETGTCYCGDYVRRDWLDQFEAKFGPTHTAAWRVVE